MKVFSMFKKRSVIIISVLALATLCFVPLSAAHYSNQSSNTNQDGQQSNANSNASNHVTIQSYPSSTSHTQVAPVSSSIDTSLSYSSDSSGSSSGSIQSSSLTTNNSLPAGSIIQTTPPVIPPSCTPCGTEQPNGIRTDVMICPMVNCPVPMPIPITNPPQPQPNPEPPVSCSGCGVSGYSTETDPHACMMVCAY